MLKGKYKSKHFHKSTEGMQLYTVLYTYIESASLKTYFYTIYELKVSPTRNIKAVFLHIHSRCQCRSYMTIMKSSIKHAY